MKYLILIALVLPSVFWAQKAKVKPRKEALSKSQVIQEKIKYESFKTSKESQEKLLKREINQVLEEQDFQLQDPGRIEDEDEQIQTQFSTLKIDSLLTTGNFSTTALGIDQTEALYPDDSESDPEAEVEIKLKGPSQFDSRIEIRDIDPSVIWHQGIIANAKSVGLVVERSMLHLVSDSIYQLDISTTLGNLYQLCPEEPFRTQPVAGTGTAFLIGKDTMLTAGHVINSKVQDYAIIFGFELENEVEAVKVLIPYTRVYFPKRIIFESTEMDVKAFTIDRDPSRKILACSHSPIPQQRIGVYMIGHPMGLPKKAAVNAGTTQRERHPRYFHTTLDAFQGNSGSPVFNKESHEVIGILVSGETDYRWTGNCRTSTLCKVPYCNGEKVIRIEEVLREINEN